MKSNTLPILSSAGLFLISTLCAAFAGTISITSGPTFSTSLPGNTVTASIIGNNLLKISGNASFTQPSTPLQSVTLTVQGNFTAARGDSFTLSYNFSSFLGGSNAMAYTLQADAVVSSAFGPISFTNLVSDNGTFDPGANMEAGMKSAAVPSQAFSLGSPISGTYTARLVLNTSTLAAGQSISLTIPTNSIDLQVAAVPEPSTYAMLGGGLVGLAFFFRKRKTF